MGICLRSDRRRNQHTIILINPIKRISKRVQTARKERNLEIEDVLSLVFSTALHRWPAHLDYLERRTQQTKASAHPLSGNGDDRFHLNLDLSMVDLDNMQRLRRSLRGATRGLQADLDTLSAFRSHGNAKTSLNLPSVMTARVSNELERSRMLSISLDDTVGLVTAAC